MAREFVEELLEGMMCYIENNYKQSNCEPPGAFDNEVILQATSESFSKQYSQLNTTNSWYMFPHPYMYNLNEFAYYAPLQTRINFSHKPEKPPKPLKAIPDVKCEKGAASKTPPDNKCAAIKGKCDNSTDLKSNQHAWDETNEIWWCEFKEELKNELLKLHSHNSNPNRTLKKNISPRNEYLVHWYFQNKAGAGRNNFNTHEIENDFDQNSVPGVFQEEGYFYGTRGRNPTSNNKIKCSANNSMKNESLQCSENNLTEDKTEDIETWVQAKSSNHSNNIHFHVDEVKPILGSMNQTNLSFEKGIKLSNFQKSYDSNDDLVSQKIYLEDTEPFKSEYKHTEENCRSSSVNQNLNIRHNEIYSKKDMELNSILNAPILLKSSSKPVVYMEKWTTESLSGKRIENANVNFSDEHIDSFGRIVNGHNATEFQKEDQTEMDDHAENPKGTATQKYILNFDEAKESSLFTEVQQVHQLSHLNLLTYFDNDLHLAKPSLQVLSPLSKEQSYKQCLHANKQYEETEESQAKRRGSHLSLLEFGFEGTGESDESASLSNIQLNDDPCRLNSENYASGRDITYAYMFEEKNPDENKTKSKGVMRTMKKQMTKFVNLLFHSGKDHKKNKN